MMNETTKTAIFLALAVVLVGLAVLTRPVVREIKMEEKVGQALFPAFTDPLAVKKLEIVRPGATGDTEDFRIAEVDGFWSIPSHDNYPADAKDRMGKVAEALVDLKVLDVVAKLDEATDTTSLHTMYGVIDPTSENASLGEGIGLKVTLTGEGEKPLVDLIVGKEVELRESAGEESGEPKKMRYVRVSGEVPVYVAEIDPARFPTKFDQWIEKNLLDINTFDVKEIFVDEYSFKVELEITQRGPREVIIPTFIGDMTFSYDGNAAGAEKWSLKNWMGFRGAKHEYYERKMKDGQELNPETLDAMISALNDLKIVDVTKKPSALAAALRQGENLESIEADPSLKKSGFYLVPMPDLKGGTAKTRKQLLSNEGDVRLRMKDGIRYQLRFGDLTGTESEIEGKAEDEKADPTLGSNRYLFITADFDSSMIPKPDMKPVPEVPESGEGEEYEKLKAEKERIEKSNKREQDRFDEAVKAGTERAKKLTERFADWYYVIPEDVYKKIHLTQTNVFRDKKIEAAPAHGEDGHECGDDCKPAVDTVSLPEKTLDLPTLPGMDGVLKTPEPTETKTVEEPKPEDAKPTEEAKPKTPETEDAKPAEEAKTEEAKPEESKKEEEKSAEEPKKEETPPEENKVFDPFGGADPTN